MPEVTVLLPFYNAQDTFDTAIKSILKQTFIDFELLLVNNNSTDQSMEITEKSAQKDSRIHVLHERNQGIVPALNKGIQNSRGKYIARMDADDISAPERLELQYKFLKANPNTGLVGSRVKLFPAATSNFGFWRYVKWQNQILTYDEILTKRFVESPVVHPSIMFRKSIAEKFGYYREGEFPEDYELFLRWLDGGVKFSKIDKVLLHWQDNKNRLTRSDKRYRQGAFFQTKLKYLAEFIKHTNPYYPNVYACGAGQNAKKWRRLLENEGLRFKAIFEVDPSKIDNKTIFHYSEIPKKGNIFIVSLVSNKDAGEKIKEFLTFNNYMEGKDFILAG